MASYASSILSALRAIVRVDHTALTPAGTHDLSADDAVELGRYDTPRRAEGYVGIWLVSYETTRQTDGLGSVPLGYYGRTLVVQCDCWAPIPESDTAGPPARIAAALDIADDVVRALEGDRRVGGLVLDSEVQVDEVAHQDLAQPRGAYGLARVRWTGYYRTTAGV